MGLEDGDNKGIDLSGVFGPDEYGFYTYQFPDGTVAYDVSENGDYKDPTGDIVHIPGFPNIIQRIPKQEISSDLLRVLKENDEDTQTATIEVGGKKYSYSTWENLGLQLKEDGVPVEEIWEICKGTDPNIEWVKLLEAIGEEIKEIEVGGKKYSYSTWENLGLQLKKDGVPDEEIWEICKGIDSNIEWVKLLEAIGEEIKEIEVGGKKYSYSTWENLGLQLKKDGVPVEEIWEICKGIDSNIQFTNFFHEATGGWGFRGMALFELQNKVEGNDDDGDERPGFHY